MTQTHSNSESELPPGWQQYEIEAVAHIQAGLPRVTDKALAVAERSTSNDEYIPLILSRDIQNEKAISVSSYTSLKILETEGLEERISDGERVFLAKSRIGTAGRVGIFKGRAIHSNGTFVIIPKTPPKVGVDFLFYYLRSIKSLLREEIVRGGKTSINAAHLNQISVPVPSSEVQHRIVARLDTITREIQRGRVQAQEQLTTIKQLTFPYDSEKAPEQLITVKQLTFFDEQEQYSSFRLKKMQAESERLRESAQQSFDYFAQIEREVLQRAFRGEL